MLGASLTIGQIGLTVTDLVRATAFYKDKLGLPFLFEAGGMAFFNCGGVRLMLSTSNTGSGFSSILYYKTPDIYTAVESLKAKGVTFEQDARMIAAMPDHELWMAFFKDSEGNLCALMSEVR